VISKQYVHFPFFFEKGMTDRVSVKGNCIDNVPSLVKETSLWLFLSWKTGYRLPYSKYYHIVSTFLVDHGVLPSFFLMQKEELHKSSNFWLKTSCKKNVLQQCSIQRELHFTSHIRF